MISRYGPASQSAVYELSHLHLDLPTQQLSGFGGLVVSMLASGTQGCGSNQVEAVGFFGQKILSMPSFGGEVKPSVPCCSCAAC
jgi:hypothetical protein